MSRNGSGTYSLPAGNPVVSGTTITSTWANNTLTDIATALTGSLAADGQTTATGALNMGTQKVTNIGNGTLPADAVAFGQLGTIASQNANNVAITGGTINGTTLGATTRADGKFTTLAANGNVSFTATGFLLIPSGTTAERPVSPANGYIRYNTSLNQFEGYANGVWGSLGGGATGGGSDQVFVENGVTVTTSYTLSTNKNAESVGPITINSGAIVTVPTGQRWVVL
jgi:hypothetical protein